MRKHRRLVWTRLVVSFSSTLSNAKACPTHTHLASCGLLPSIRHGVGGWGPGPRLLSRAAGGRFQFHICMGGLLFLPTLPPHPHPRTAPRPPFPLASLRNVPTAKVEGEAAPRPQRAGGSPNHESGRRRSRRERGGVWGHTNHALPATPHTTHRTPTGMPPTPLHPPCTRVVPRALWPATCPCAHAWPGDRWRAWREKGASSLVVAPHAHVVCLGPLRPSHAAHALVEAWRRHPCSAAWGEAARRPGRGGRRGGGQRRLRSCSGGNGEGCRGVPCGPSGTPPTPLCPPPRPRTPSRPSWPPARPCVGGQGKRAWSGRCCIIIPPHHPMLRATHPLTSFPPHPPPTGLSSSPQERLP